MGRLFEPERLRHVLEEKIGSETGYLSLNLGAAERVIDEVAQEFDGEDPCRPAQRELLEETQAGLKDNLDLARRLIGPIELQAPPEEVLETMREGARRPIIEE